MSRRRRMRVESLEDRRMLATFTVTNLLDGPVTAAGQLPGSLRQAIFDANAAAGTDEIGFAPALSGQTIALGGMELAIAEALIIDATALGANVTIDAQQNSRIFNITATTGDFTLAGLTLTGGRTTGGDPFLNNGGALYSRTTGNLTLNQSTVSGNSTTGAWAEGGGLYATGNLNLIHSHVSENSTAGIYARGGGISGLGNVTLTHSTVSGNTTTERSGHGGGIFSWGNVTLTESTVSGNSANTTGGSIYGYPAWGGGIFSWGDVTLTQSIVSENSAVGGWATGGGINAMGDVTLIESTVSGNNATGTQVQGGGIVATGDVMLTLSHVSHNHAEGSQTSSGGGIQATGDVMVVQSSVDGNIAQGPQVRGGGVLTIGGEVTVAQSTISGNSATGTQARGGGIYAHFSLVLNQSTVSGNHAAGTGARGGGVFVNSTVMLTQSTVTDNHALHVTGLGGGVFQPDTDFDNPFSSSGSIVAGNTAGGGGADLVFDPENLTINYSLIGVAPAGMTGVGNLTGIAISPLDPLLGPLADNGGSTRTHALLPGSPAMNAGDPGFISPPDYDQRGAGFARVFGGRIDIGAYEVQSPTPATGDFDADGDIDGRDFLFWQRGESPDPWSANDLAAWQEEYGVEGLLAVSSQLLASEEGSGVGGQGAGEISDLGFLISDGRAVNVSDRSEGAEISDGRAVNVSDRSRDGEEWNSTSSMAPWALNVLFGTRAGGPCYDEAYVEQVDLALEELSNSRTLPGQPTVAHEFGEMVARRGVVNRLQKQPRL